MPLPVIKRERIAVLLHDLSGGGSERIAIRLAREWARQGRQVFLICGDPTGPLRALVPDTVELVLPDPLIRRGRGSRRALGAAAAVLASRCGAEAIFIPGNYHAPAVPALLSSTGVRRPVVVVKLSNPVERADRGRAAQWLFERHLHRQIGNADAIVAMSPALAVQAQARLRHIPVHVIDEPILDQAAVYGRTAARGNRINLLAAGRLVRQKNFGLAVRAVAKLRDPRVCLTIVGDGPERDTLSRLALSVGLAGQVSFPGHVADIRPWLAAARLFLLPSIFEGYPAVAVEALAAGVPVIASDCSLAMAEIITSPDLGFVVPGNEPDQYAAAIRHYLDRPAPDPARLATTVERHRIGPIAERYLALIDSLR
jgi:glycosyltransferase involved in cell wall biosynthesis